MYKKTIEYTDYNGIKRTEDFFFALNQAEAIDMETSYEGGLVAYARRMIAANNQNELVKLFQQLLLRTYGEKSPDGKLFIKEDLIDGHPLYYKFKQSPAYTYMYMLLATDDQEAARFVNEIVPEKVIDENGKEISFAELRKRMEAEETAGLTDDANKVVDLPKKAGE